MMRRLIDVVIALLVLIVASPLFAVLSAAIPIDSPGSPFYGGRRVGRDGRLFRMWKFRTMVANADAVGPGITGARDPRITRLGAFLRATKLDELPQCWNLLIGDMTLVGPRAEVPDIVARYTPEQREILSALPGITGPGQIHYTTDQAETIPEGADAADFYVEHLLGPKLEIDRKYLESRNAGRDFAIICSTIAMIFGALFGSMIPRRKQS
jgi:lipopolysaccharide/colanic/teichoic acid biosynthesis glycosyltransferase